jgi:cytochrome c-550 PedF
MISQQSGAKMSNHSNRAAFFTTIAMSVSLLLTWMASSTVGHSHGDVTPQAVDTEGLEPLGEEFREENPYRLMGGEQYELAIQIGASGYNQNCARCHGLEAISGGIAPDLRLLEDGEFGDEWFMERVRNGYSQNGAYKMPPYEELLSQEAMWAIRSYIENRPKE